MPKFGPLANHLDEGISKALEGVVTTLEENVERDGVAEEVKEVGGEELQNGPEDLFKSRLLNMNRRLRHQPQKVKPKI